MPSIKTRVAYDRIILAAAEEALAEATAQLTETTEAVSDATGDLEALATGNLDLAAIQIGGVRFVNNAGVLEPE